MHVDLIKRLRTIHVRLDHDLRAEIARRYPDQARVNALKKLKLSIKDRLNAVGPNTATA
ncbi:YdcH family protein [Glacieibacterium frigidum]|uniref:DUF465 domain-containing protein n=1 Tax=Glacieibacterium frigidum TaxID=2593303 RepID=A0A552UIJ2_9SPHN|nr:YdcH family protein [Glacieibacterium frigidum]TRW18010.1 DUF465 domain-containing protein [Glacieibacterium frigidum]